MKGQRRPQDFPHLAALNGLYDSAIYYVDESFGSLVDALKREALYDSLLIVLTADHGEEFLDHGRFQHGQIYSETLHVPLIVKWPGEDRGRLEERDVRLADIVPTLLEAADVAVPDAVEGRSLAPTSQTDRALFAFHQDPPEPEPRLRSFAMRDGQWTLVQHESADGQETRAELYQTATDFEQQRPVAGEGERAAAMLAAIEAWRGQSQPQQGEKIELDAETLEHLRALGYLD